MAATDLFLTLLAAETPPEAGLADALIAQADAMIMGYLGRASLPPDLPDAPRAALAVVLYNRRGTEGEVRRVEGEVSAAFEPLPRAILTQLRPYRKALLLSPDAFLPPVP